MTNNTTISGQIIYDFTFDHETHGERFMTSTIHVERESGNSDDIQIIISERLLDNISYKDKFVLVHGQFRSHTNKKHIVLYLFVNDLSLWEEVFENSISFCGYICKEPKFRTTPFGREITDILVSVPRAYNKTDCVPCIAWGRSARYAANYTIGDYVEIKGRVQSRDYTKNGEIKTVYEVSIEWISCQHMQREA